MTKIKLSILDKNLNIRQGKNHSDESALPMTASGEGRVYLATQGFSYEDGDIIKVEVEEPSTYLVAKLDETIDSTLVFIKDKEWEYRISMTDNAKEARPDQRFMNTRHYLCLRTATAEEIASYRNLALNPHDQKEFHGAYPHAFANVETRNDATFFACNAIDGVYATHLHGSYPYQSWGISQQMDAALTIDFGRQVELDKVTFILRADFPHDSHWKEVTLTFSDGSKETFATEKTGKPQTFTFSKRQVSSVIFSDLKQEDDPSPFPALTEIEFYGKNVLA